MLRENKIYYYFYFYIYMLRLVNAGVNADETQCPKKERFEKAASSLSGLGVSDIYSDIIFNICRAFHFYPWCEIFI